MRYFGIVCGCRTNRKYTPNLTGLARWGLGSREVSWSVGGAVEYLSHWANGTSWWLVFFFFSDQERRNPGFIATAIY